MNANATCAWFVRESFRCAFLAVLFGVSVLSVGCAKQAAPVETWQVRMFPSGGVAVLVLEEPQVVVKFDGVHMADLFIREQVVIAGDAESDGSGQGGSGFRYKRVYADGVATLQINDYVIRISEKGTRLAIGDTELSLPTKERIVLAIDADGKPREVGEAERETILQDAERPEALGFERPRKGPRTS